MTILSFTTDDNHCPVFTRAAMVLLALLLTATAAWAKPVDEAEARQRAEAFLRQRGCSLPATPMRVAPGRRRAPTGDAGAATASPAYYVFNVGDDEGFVIVSGDDRTLEILGYADSGCIDEEAMPDGLRYLLDGYEEQISGLTLDEGEPLYQSSYASIAPLITTHWNQSEPYNNFCPVIDDTRTVTGCVATSMAQVMFYHKCPTTACGDIPAYTTYPKKQDGSPDTLIIAALSGTTFDWNNMLLNYTPINPETGKRYLDGTETQQEAVAKLMQYCGSALQMCYGLSANGGSSAYNEAIPDALKTFFGYDGSTRNCYRKNYSYAGWVELIYSELSANRPVILGGQSCGGGHSFVCDGYDTNDHSTGANGDYFHINWGWAGSSDGYFLLSVLQPRAQGIGGSSTLDGFSFGQNAVIGIRPPADDAVPDYCLSLEGLHLGSPNATSTSKTFTRTSAAEPFTDISIYLDVYNYHYGTNHFDVTVQIVDDSGNVVQTIMTFENQEMTWNLHIQGTLTPITIPASVEDGTYYIKVMSRPTGSTTWQECFDGDAYRLTAVISDTELTITVPIPSNVRPAATLDVTGDLLVGSEQTVTATITGGSGPYNGDVILRVNGSPVMGQILNIAAGETVRAQFSFIPSQGGKNTLALYNARTGGSQIGSSKVVVIGGLALANANDNQTAISNNDGALANVTLDARTLYKDGAWNTLCLPFDLEDDDVSEEHPASEGGRDGSTFTGTPLAGAVVRTLQAASLSEAGQLNLTFSDPVTTITAGTPYLIKWPNDTEQPTISNPVFNGVDIDATDRSVSFNLNSPSGDGEASITFCGTYTNTTFDSDNRSVLFLGANNTLYWPQNGASIGAQRAYFQLHGITMGDPDHSDIKAFSLNFGEETGIKTPSPLMGERLSPSSVGWATLNGIHLTTKPTAKGIYIHGNRKVVIK